MAVSRHDRPSIRIDAQRETHDDDLGTPKNQRQNRHFEDSDVERDESIDDPVQ
jgi:hypothetical protein